MLRRIVTALALALVARPALAQVHPFPAAFRTQEIATNGVRLNVRTGGCGPAVLLLH
ncbi:MAG: alpha/beta hydrolase, partial [Rubritepida sp.]|nr:alpha/beta hydrolase [Rubritepida sp.]